MIDKNDTPDKQPERPRTRSRCAGVVRLLFIAVAITFVLGCEQCYIDRRPPSITCRDIRLFMEPGTCLPLLNPSTADGRWASPPRYDGFRLCPTVEQRELFADSQITIRTTRTNGEVTREICVGANSPSFANEDIEYIYGRGPQYGTASLFLTVGTPLRAEVSATPSNIAPGGSSQLAAAVRGGFPPYFYSWRRDPGLNDYDIAAPRATPQVTTVYSVTVRDSSGQEITRPVTVSVGMALTVTADPPQINPGDASLLQAIVVGGVPPYTYSWTPANTLDDPRRQDPIATPTTTTTYQVTVRDSLGATQNGSTTVSVRLGLTVTANPLSIAPGETSQLNVIVVGGVPPYTYSWTPANTLDRPQEANPVATPAATTTYQVIVRDSAGAMSGGSVTVTVGNGPPPTASFVFTIAGPILNLDASASTGNSLSYIWDLSWTTANPDRITLSPTTSFTFREFDRGIITLTVTDAFGRTATATRNFP